MCQHQPQCPDWSAPDHLAARIVADQPGQGWSLLSSSEVTLMVGPAATFRLAGQDPARRGRP
jgi:hypothetical protein